MGEVTLALTAEEMKAVERAVNEVLMETEAIRFRYIMFGGDKPDNTKGELLRSAYNKMKGWVCDSSGS